LAYGPAAQKCEKDARKVLHATLCIAGDLRNAMPALLLAALIRLNLYDPVVHGPLMKMCAHTSSWRRFVELYLETDPDDAKWQLHVLFFGGAWFAEIPFIVALSHAAMDACDRLSSLPEYRDIAEGYKFRGKASVLAAICAREENRAINVITDHVRVVEGTSINGYIFDEVMVRVRDSLPNGEMCIDTIVRVCDVLIAFGKAAFQVQCDIKTSWVEEHVQLDELPPAFGLLARGQVRIDESRPLRRTNQHLYVAIDTNPRGDGPHTPGRLNLFSHSSPTQSNQPALSQVGVDTEKVEDARVFLENCSWEHIVYEPGLWVVVFFPKENGHFFSVEIASNGWALLRDGHLQYMGHLKIADFDAAIDALLTKEVACEFFLRTQSMPADWNPDEPESGSYGCCIKFPQAPRA
jgi:hypothetical protein